MVYTWFVAVKKQTRKPIPVTTKPVLRRPRKPSTQQEKNMKLNVGSIDRALRVVAGLALIGLTLAGMIGVWGWIGIVPLATALFSFCPLYTLLGVNTCPMKAKG